MARRYPRSVGSHLDVHDALLVLLVLVLQAAFLYQAWRLIP